MANVQENVTNFSIGIGPISLSAKNAQKAEVWAEGTDQQVAGLGGTHSAKGWAQVAQEAAGKAKWGEIEGSLAAQTDLKNALDSKQGNLNTEQLVAANSGITSTLVGKITSNESAISSIEGKIPAQATTSNQLADKNFVNSSIATNTANFIGTFNSVAELEAYSGTLTNNDYSFVIGTDAAGNTTYNRYKYTTATTPAEWEFEYTLNNSSFTADQWASINSGITGTLVTQINTGTTGYYLQKTADGVQWAEVQASGAPTLTWYTNNTGTTLTIADTSGASLVKVYRNGLLQQPTEDYTISGTTLTLSVAITVNDKITLEVFN